MFRQFRSAFLVFILTAVLLLVTACASQSQPPTPTSTLPPPPTRELLKEEGILGRWKGVDQGNEVIFLFDGEGKVTLAYLGALHGGTYTLNEQTSPMQLDLVWDDIGSVLTILEFVNKDTIRLENNYPSVDRPTTFSDFVTLTRMK